MKSEYINGIKIYAPKSTKNLIDCAIENKKILLAINAEKILQANLKIKNISKNNLAYPDGVGAVWALRKKGIKEVFKIPGCELWLDIIKRYYKNKTFYLIGGKQQVIEDTVNKLEKDFIGINILNFCNGYIKTNKEKADLIKDIKSLKPDIVFVAIGSPKQEFLIEEIQQAHKASYMGLGGSFDVFIGKLNRAPSWMINSNLEWSYRLIIQPFRIKRQLHLIRFFILLHLNKF